MVKRATHSPWVAIAGRGIPLSQEANQLMGFLKRDNPQVRIFVLRSFMGLPTSLEAEEAAVAYFAKNSSIGAAVLASPGSSVISETLYEGGHTFSPIDRYFFESKGGRAVRARLLAVEDRLPDIINELLRQGRGVRIGNLGSGPGRDVIDVLAEHYIGVTSVTAVNADIDEMAVMRGKRMAEIKGVSHLITFTRADFVSYARHNRQKFDILLLIGMLCPFDTDSCTLYLEMVKKLLKPGGYLIASNISKRMLAEDPFTCHLMAALGNWVMIYKDEQELRGIFEKAGYAWQGSFTDSFGFHIMGVGSPVEL